MARDLSPYSARKLLTQKLVEGNTGTPQPSKSRSRSRDRSLRNGSQPARKEPSKPSGHQSRSGSNERRPRIPSREGKPKDATIEADAVVGKRGVSPEPYKKPRESSRERKREGSRDRKRDRSTDRRRDRSRDRRRDRSGERHRDRSRDRRRDRSKDRHSRRDRSRSRDRRRKDKTKDDRRSRSPIPYRSRKQRTRSPSTSTSPPPKRRRRTRSHSRSPSPPKRVKQPLPSQEVSFRGLDDSAQPPSKYGGAPPDKEKPNFKTTGVLAKYANRVEGTKISLKYHEPPEARKPPSSQPWRIFVFKGEDVVDTIEIGQKSCWLLGRSQEVVDYLLEHPSSSGQHAVIQFRYIQKTVEDEFGVKSKRGKVKPYIIDLESSNGTELNGKTVEASRYFELRDKDILKFAGSEREYVVMLPPPDEK
ncbi:SMAD/FHA domain-containing protein [Cucurbitaria berberidis CBS 394.84]|uniref:SMAD/FHA domain-containing protein n=1 Tax=Cucurbitaria berberidis CBS 394.84 TaxID=1168544 RepID=A0A9P4GEC8_9PLEO|nr:SMAD/FHA domain-containing protein [Cucurbitaria berberidis CBS 394.84]KAF1843914.1 SMAD/FHA domain-containing protein [Cucurbitaria berberidis CBS 394.84]